jgi:hypothetical protein
MYTVGPYLEKESDSDNYRWHYFAITKGEPALVTHYSAPYSGGEWRQEAASDKKYYLYDPTQKTSACYFIEENSLRKVPLSHIGQEGNKQAFINVVNKVQWNATEKQATWALVNHKRAGSYGINITLFPEALKQKTISAAPSLPQIGSSTSSSQNSHTSTSINDAVTLLKPNTCMRVANHEGLPALAEQTIYVWKNENIWHYELFFLGNVKTGKLDEQQDANVISRLEQLEEGEILTSTSTGGEALLSNITRSYLALTPNQQHQINAALRTEWPTTELVSVEEEMAVCRALLNRKRLSSEATSSSVRIGELNEVIAQFLPYMLDASYIARLVNHSLFYPAHPDPGYNTTIKDAWCYIHYLLMAATRKLGHNEEIPLPAKPPEDSDQKLSQYSGTEQILYTGLSGLSDTLFDVVMRTGARPHVGQSKDELNALANCLKTIIDSGTLQTNTELSYNTKEAIEESSADLLAAISAQNGITQEVAKGMLFKQCEARLAEVDFLLLDLNNIAAQVNNFNTFFKFFRVSSRIQTETLMRNFISACLPEFITWGETVEQLRHLVDILNEEQQSTLFTPENGRAILSLILKENTNRDTSLFLSLYHKIKSKIAKAALIIACFPQLITWKGDIELLPALLSELDAQQQSTLLTPENINTILSRIAKEAENKKTSFFLSLCRAIKSKTAKAALIIACFPQLITWKGDIELLPALLSELDAQQQSTLLTPENINTILSRIAKEAENKKTSFFLSLCRAIKSKTAKAALIIACFAKLITWKGGIELLPELLTKLDPEQQSALFTPENVNAVIDGINNRAANAEQDSNTMLLLKLHYEICSPEKKAALLNAALPGLSRWTISPEDTIRLAQRLDTEQEESYFTTEVITAISLRLKESKSKQAKLYYFDSYCTLSLAIISQKIKEVLFTSFLPHFINLVENASNVSYLTGRLTTNQQNKFLSENNMPAIINLFTYDSCLTNADGAFESFCGLIKSPTKKEAIINARNNTTYYIVNALQIYINERETQLNNTSVTNVYLSLFNSPQSGKNKVAAAKWLKSLLNPSTNEGAASTHEAYQTHKASLSQGELAAIHTSPTVQALIRDLPRMNASSDSSPANS